VKDHKAERDADGRPIMTELGNGVLDWPAVFEAARAAGVQWLVYEQDTIERDVFESCAISYEFLSRSAQGKIPA
jgi:sugar phosphate isomerase/epimerase